MDYKDLQAGQTKEDFWFKAKNDLVEILMARVYKNKRPLRILNVGPGTGDDLKILNKFGSVYLVDIDKKALSLIDGESCAEKRFTDACDLPYEDNFFDIIVSFDVFEHIKDDRQAVDEAYRVLKQNGVLIFSVPVFQFLFSSHDKALLHQRRYNKKTIRNLLSKFNQIKFFFWNSLLFAPIVVLRLIKKKARPEVDTMNLPPWLNLLFYKLLLVDNFFIKRGISLPIGLSLVGWCHK